jgi:hypothetical protein
MNGTRLSVSIPDVDTGMLARVAPLADRYNIDIWVGDPEGTFDDTYVMTIAAAVAAVTADVRLGVFLTVSGSATPLRLAEDIGLVDQAASGRLELGIVAPSEDLSGWEGRVAQMLGAWHEWPAGDGVTVAASPRPSQPWMSRLVVGEGDLGEVADRLRAGVIVRNGELSIPDPHPIPRRTVLAVAPELGAEGINGWLRDDPLRCIRELRAQVDALGAHEVMIVLRDADPDRLPFDLQSLGTLFGPGLRCSAHQADFFVHDAWEWLTTLKHLHEPPTETD